MTERESGRADVGTSRSSCRSARRLPMDRYVCRHFFLGEIGRVLSNETSRRLPPPPPPPSLYVNEPMTEKLTVAPLRGTI